jgi:hypothetical protein
MVAIFAADEPRSVTILSVQRVMTIYATCPDHAGVPARRTYP